MKRFCFFFLLSLLFTSPLYAADQKETAFERVMRTGTLRCGFVPWPPGFEVDPNSGEVKGLSKDLFEGIIGLTGWKVEFIEVALGNNALDLSNDRIDAMCADAPWTISSVKFVDYTTWAAYSPVLVYVRNDETRFKSYKDLDAQDVSFVGIDGDISSDLATLRFPKAKLRTLINLTDPAQMMLEVADGKADAVILDPITAENFMRNNQGRMKELAGVEPLAVYPVGFSVKRGESDLQQTLDRATEMAVNIGMIDQTLDLYDPERRTIYAPARTYRIPQK